MNNVKIAYAYGGETKSLILEDVERVSEAFSINAKDLSITTDAETLTDETLAELMNSTIHEVSIASDNLNTILHDYTNVRAINKEYDLNNGVIKIFIYMQKWLGAEVNE